MLFLQAIPQKGSIFIGEDGLLIYRRQEDGSIVLAQIDQSFLCWFELGHVIIKPLDCTPMISRFLSIKGRFFEIAIGSGLRVTEILPQAEIKIVLDIKNPHLDNICRTEGLQKRFLFFSYSRHANYAVLAFHEQDERRITIVTIQFGTFLILHTMEIIEGIDIDRDDLNINCLLQSPTPLLFLQSRGADIIIWKGKIYKSTRAGLNQALEASFSHSIGKLEKYVRSSSGLMFIDEIRTNFSGLM
jgi:hypothetical protein